MAPRTPPPGTHHSNDLWAPELHCLHGRWYVYYAACHPQSGNKSHRMYILGGPPAASDPIQGHWEFLGPIENMDQAQWAIDGTVIELDHQLYFVYSGWPFDNPGESDLIQQIFILRLSDPTTAASPPTLLCKPEAPWEWTADHGINEGAQYLAAPDGSWRGVVYSCAGSWTKDYKMNTLQYVHGDPLDVASWRKGTKPLIQNGNHDKGPWGPGHGSFVHVGQETVSIYHATDGHGDGWNNRKARMQRVVFVDGQPYMSGVVGHLTSDYAEFLGREGVGGGDHKKHGLGAWFKRLKDEL